MASSKATGTRKGFARKGTSLVDQETLEVTLRPIRTEILRRQREDGKLQEQLDEAGDWCQTLDDRLLLIQLRLERVERVWYRRLWRWVTRQPDPSAIPLPPRAEEPKDG